MNLAWVLRRWIGEQARAGIHKTVAQGFSGQAGPDAAVSAPVQPCDVGLVFALSIESGCTEDLLDGVVTTRGDGFLVRQGSLAGRGIVIVEAGAGKLAAARATQALVAGHRPRWIISAGFAGGLVDPLRRGDFLMASEIVDTSGKKLSIDFKIDAAALSSSKTVCHVGRLLTTDRIVSRAAEKRELGLTHQALAVDMESWAVGEVCRQDKVRFLAIRIVSDAVDDELPGDLGRMLMQRTRAGRFGAVAGTLFRRPASIKDMFKLKEEALIASDRLAKFLRGVIEQLVPEPPSQ